METTSQRGDGPSFRRWHPYYRYSPLPGNTIRLIKIICPEYIPNREKIFEDLQLSMITVNLADAPVYDALSYTWGDPTPEPDPTTEKFTKVARCFPIECDGRAVLGTRNLRDALRQLRCSQHPEAQKLHVEAAQRKPSKYMWIDAICINQEDIKERSQQVKMMGTIYETAEAVIAWLGEPDIRARNALKLAERLSQADFGKLTHAKDWNLAFEDPDFYRVHGIDPISREQWLDYALFFGRNWFTRAWILQEVRLAKKAEVLCGDMFCAMGMLRQSLQFVNLCGFGFPIHLTQIEAIKSDVSLDSAWQLEVRHFKTELRLFQISERSILEQGKFSFLTNLAFNSATEATLPHDMVYSLIGISTEFGEPASFEVDYSKPVEDVYIETTRFILQSRMDLELLSARQAPRATRLKSLPSLYEEEPDSYQFLPAMHTLPKIPGTLEDDEQDTLTIPIPAELLDLTAASVHRAQQYTVKAATKVLYRALFRTKNQHIGLGPDWVQKQDEIWLIQGARMPIVLRPLPNGHYIWIGEAYIAGIMYGEAIPFAEESREIVLE
ncbi:Ubiquitin-like protein [Diplodia seriata]|uniref:Ubiquitin-like protein n=1 Tax=Diplodia seriata TaxID=420778 RepID=A0ABR3C617_9PEZI